MASTAVTSISFEICESLKRVAGRRLRGSEAEESAAAPDDDDEASAFSFEEGLMMPRAACCRARFKAS